MFVGFKLQWVNIDPAGFRKPARSATEEQTMNYHPLIGITTSARTETGHFRLSTSYVDAIRRAGGIPILLPPGEPFQEELLERLDGLILSGGGDVDPAYYGGRPHPTMFSIDAERDESELALVQQLVARGTPALCICRGAQVANVALGGTLVEHLPDEVGEAVIHRAAPEAPAALHTVNVEPDSRLAEVMGQNEVRPVSWHHQAARDVAPDLRVVAQAADGTIEALEMPSHPWLIALQWHPEITAGDDPSQQRIFEALVAAAAVAQSKRQNLQG
jgi:putative glutamine amidotransferase